jgi:DNA-binding NtrC family response regulator
MLTEIQSMKQRKKVLFIDDEVDLCTLMRNYFRRKDYEVFIAHNAQDAIQCLNQVTPDFIFLSTEIKDWELVRKHAAIKAPNAKFF